MLTDGGILMKKIGKFITEHSLLIVIISLVLLIPAMIGFISTKTNYDILVYLPEDIETVQGQNILTDEFNLGAFSFGNSIPYSTHFRYCPDSISSEKKYRQLS